jgi:hypothetical protein
MTENEEPTTGEVGGANEGEEREPETGDVGGWEGAPDWGEPSDDDAGEHDEEWASGPLSDVSQNLEDGGTDDDATA